MKDLYGLEASGLPPELIARLTGVSRDQLIADALTKQSLEPVQNMGGPGAKLSWTQGLDKVLKAYLGRKGAEGATAERGAIEAEAESGRKSAMEAYFNQARDKAGVPYVDATGAEGDQGMTSGVAGDRRGAIENAQFSPYLRGSQFIRDERQDIARTEQREDQQAFLDKQAKQAQAEKAANLVSQLEQRKYEADLRAQDKSLDRDSRERMASQSAAIQREIALARAEAARAAAEARGDAKAAANQAKADKTNEAKGQVTNLLGELGGKFERLNEMGAAVDTSKSGMNNALASLRASSPGQMLGGALGTKEQVVRDEIRQFKPILMNAIRQATSQGVRGLDSNRELDFYLQAVADETKSIQYNRAALKILEKAYGLGTGIKGVTDADVEAVKADFAAASAPAPGVPDQSAIDAELKRRGL